MNDAELRKIASMGEPCMVCVDRSLYFRISQQGTAFWVFRYSINGKRRSQQIGRYGKPPEGMSLRVARDLPALHRSMVRDGIDPLAESKRPSLVNLKTVNEVAKDWLDDCQKRLANPRISERVFYKDIAPSIGDLAIERVTPIPKDGLWKGLGDVEHARLNWVDWFNNRRLLGPIGDIPPVEYENMYYQQAESAAA